ncbi:hypothetical protein NS07_v2contig00206-0001 [Nocardia seriolae]|nr:hypothetical protein NSERUTF1_1929 [Nocardia seriolae]GAM51121.1 hypothetical protein NS07_v2contig00206-0001 [Nocardia seriolae]
MPGRGRGLHALLRGCEGNSWRARHRPQRLRLVHDSQEFCCISGFPPLDLPCPGSNQPAHRRRPLSSPRTTASPLERPAAP